jgi:hypothetical protein
MELTFFDETGGGRGILRISYNYTLFMTFFGVCEKINKIKINGLQYWIPFYTCNKYILYLCSYSLNSNGMAPVKVTEGEKARAPGHHMGLTVLVDPQSEDYYYPLLAAYGVKVKT